MEEAIGRSNIRFAGHLSRTEIIDLMRTSRGVVFPSRWPETFGLVYIEALAMGTPVLATPPSAAAAFVERDGTGITTRELSPDVIEHAHDRFASLRPRARAVFEDRYTETAHVEALDVLYGSVT
jgi:glycosyltransferase involved in cell wall biosynthesis